MVGIKKDDLLQGLTQPYSVVLYNIIVLGHSRPWVSPIVNVNLK